MNRALRLALILAMLSSSPVQGQGLRTAVPAIVTVSAAEPEGSTVVLRYNEAVAVLLSDKPFFIEGLEFELRVPKAFQGSESSIAWSLYSSVKPMPTKERLDYDAELIATQPLPARVSMNLILPVVERHRIRGGPFASIIPSIALPGRFPLLFKLSPIGKGLSPVMEKAEFRLTVRPVLSDEGGIVVSYSYPDGADPVQASVFLGDKRIDKPQDMITARKGAYVVRVHADGYKEEIVTVAVEPGKIVPVHVSLVPDIPLFIFRGPAGTVFTLDGQPVETAELGGLQVEPGEHTVHIRLGDYSMTRKIMAQRGKVYTISMTVDLDIKTSP